MSIWKYYARNSIIEEFLFKRKNPFYWGAINAENCKSANNKNCYMAMCRAAKNKKRILHLFKRRQRIRNIKLT